MDKKTKLYDVVYLRSLAIIMVVVYHCFCIYTGKWDHYYKFDTSIPIEIKNTYQFLFNRILLFRMPLFIFISGYLFSCLLSKGKYKDTNKFIQLKFKRLIIPCLIFTVIMSISYNDFSIDKLITASYHLWFLWMLFWSFIITHFINKSKYNFYIAIVSILLSIWMHPLFNTNILSISATFRYLHFFLIGYLIYNKKGYIEPIITNKYTIITLSVTIILLLFLGMLRLYIITCIMLIYSIITTLIRNNTLKESQFCDKLNQYSYGIYVFHHWILLFPLFYSEKPIFRNIIHIMKVHYIFYPLISFFLVFIFSIGLSMIVLRTRIGRYLIG